GRARLVMLAGLAMCLIWSAAARGQTGNSPGGSAPPAATPTPPAPSSPPGLSAPPGGPAGPSTVWDQYMNAAARAYREDRFDEAERLLEAGFDEAERGGPEDPRTSATLNSLALLYVPRGKPMEAEALYQHALSTREKLLGAWHPSVATSLNNLASFYVLQGKS